MWIQALDVVVENAIILELKTCEEIEPIHKAQLLTYLKLSKLSLGLLLNFDVSLMRDGIVRIVNDFNEKFENCYEDWKITSE